MTMTTDIIATTDARVFSPCPSRRRPRSSVPLCEEEEDDDGHRETLETYTGTTLDRVGFGKFWPQRR